VALSYDIDPVEVHGGGLDPVERHHGELVHGRSSGSGLDLLRIRRRRPRSVADLAAGRGGRLQARPPPSPA
jgi:hypothetical protein